MAKYRLRRVSDGMVYEVTKLTSLERFRIYHGRTILEEVLELRSLNKRKPKTVSLSAWNSTSARARLLILQKNIINEIKKDPENYKF